MTTYLIPCGLSILDGLRRGRGAPDGHGDIETAIGELENWAVGKHRIDPAALGEGWRGSYARHSRALALPTWDAAICAEVSTLDGRTRTGGRFTGLLDGSRNPGGTRDTMILLASDTDDGLLAALLAATRIAHGHTDLLRYAASPTELGKPGSYPLDPGHVVVIRISGLTAETTDGFDRAAYGIGDVMRAVHVDLSDNVEVHLSGGHKATLLYGLTLAEMLRSVVPGNREVTAHYLFELEKADKQNQYQGPGRPPRKPTQIRLRKFPAAVVTAMARELDKAYRGLEAPDDDSLPFVFAEVGWTKDHSNVECSTRSATASVPCSAGPGRCRPEPRAKEMTVAGKATRGEGDWVEHAAKLPVTAGLRIKGGRRPERVRKPPSGAIKSHIIDRWFDDDPQADEGS